MKLNEDYVRETYTFQSFKCDECNEEAVAACKADAERRICCWRSVTR